MYTAHLCRALCSGFYRHYVIGPMETFWRWYHYHSSIISINLVLPGVSILPKDLGKC